MAKKRVGEPVQLHAYINQEQAEALNSAAERNQTSVSDIVRRALRHYFSLPENATLSSDSSNAA